MMTLRELADAGVVLASSLGPPLPERFFSGIAFTASSIIIGQEGMDAYCAAHPFQASDLIDGRFLYCGRDEGGWVARTDPFGQEAIFYYAEGGRWAFSNSFWALCLHLVEHGIQLEIRMPALIGFFVKHPLRRVLLSNRSVVEQIRVVPLDHAIHVADGGGLEVVRERQPVAPRAGSVGSYEDLLVSYAGTALSRMRSLLDFGGGSVTLDITGGYDSRVVLALASATGADLSVVNLRSDPKQRADLQVARKLAALLGLSLNRRGNQPSEIDSETALQLWKYGNLAVYTGFYRPVRNKPAGGLHLNGGGGECLRPSAYSRNAIEYASEVIRRNHNSPSAEIAMRELLDSFADIGVAADDPLAMSLHDRHFSSRFHFGRNWYGSLVGGRLVTPLLSRQLVQAWERLPAEALARNQIFCDLLLLLEPRFAEVPFDREYKSFPAEALESSPFRRCRPALGAEIRSMEIFGRLEHDPPRKPGAPRDTFMEALKAEGRHSAEHAGRLGVYSPKRLKRVLSRLDGMERPTYDNVATRLIMAGELAGLVSQERPIETSGRIRWLTTFIRSFTTPLGRA